MQLVLICPPLASALLTETTHQRGKHHGAAHCCIQSGTGSAGRGEFVAGGFLAHVGDLHAVGQDVFFTFLQPGQVLDFKAVAAERGRVSGDRVPVFVGQNKAVLIIAAAQAIGRIGIVQQIVDGVLVFVGQNKAVLIIAAA